MRLLRRAPQITQDAARFGDQRVGDGVDGADRIHAVHAQHHVGGASVRRGAAAQPGVAATRHHRDRGLLAQGQAARHLVHRARAHHGLRIATIKAAPVGEPRRNLVGLGGNHVGAERFDQAGQEI